MSRCGQSSWRRRNEFSSAPPHAPPAAIFGGRLRLRLDTVERIGIPLDPDHRKDDDCCGLAGLAAEAHNAPVVREFDNGAHPAVSYAAGRSVMLRCAEAASPAIKRHARLTVRYIQALDSTKAEWSKVAWRNPGTSIIAI